MSQQWNKVIYQTYECNFDELHEIFKTNCELWKSFYPNWKYHFSNSKERREEVKSILNLSDAGIEVYDNCSGMLQSDFWRFAMTGAYGGMYSDLDSIPISNIEPVMYNLDNKIEMIAMPDGYQRGGLPGSNTSNYILASKSTIGEEMISGLNEFLEHCAFMKKNDIIPPILRSTEYFANLIVSNIDKVAQIYSEKYVKHRFEYKPEKSYLIATRKRFSDTFFGDGYTVEDARFFEKGV